MIKTQKLIIDDEEVDIAIDYPSDKIELPIMEDLDETTDLTKVIEAIGDNVNE